MPLILRETRADGPLYRASCRASPDANGRIAQYAYSMSLSRQSELDAAYENYYSKASEAELSEEASWAEFATEQLAAIYCDED